VKDGLGIASGILWMSTSSESPTSEKKKSKFSPIFISF
jgi:hypothetical protein